MKIASIGLIFIFITLILASCGGGYSSYTTKSGWKVSYPRGWEVLAEVDDNVSFIDPDSKSIFVASQIIPTQPKTDAEILDFYKSYKTLDGNGDISFGDMPGKYIEYTNTLGSLTFFHKEAWVSMNNLLYTVACTIPGKSKETLTESCNQMIHSLQGK